MIIKVEVGTREQQIAIRKELENIFSVLEPIENQINILQIIVPIDFDKIVNNILGNDSYQSSQPFGENVTQVEAKVVNTKEGMIIIISPKLFSDSYDPIIRANIYLHEIVHCINAYKLPPEPSGRTAKDNYLHILRILIDEYFADMKSYKGVDVCCKEKTEYWRISIERSFKGYCALINDTKLLEQLEKLRNEFIVHKDIRRYLREITPIIDAVLKSITHAFALSDYYPNICLSYKIISSTFVNEDICLLVDYIRKKYNINEYTIDDGEQIITMAIKIFGITLRNEGDKLICKLNQIGKA